MEDDPEFVELRNRMVTEQIISRGIQDERVLDALRRVPRHWFVPPEYANIAYSDSPLPIGHGQTISQPYIVALMTELLELRGDENVLEIGTGSGYQAAVLAGMSAEVHTVELIPELADGAAGLLQELGYANVHVHCADGSGGWPFNAPYGGVLVAAAAPAPGYSRAPCP